MLNSTSRDQERALLLVVCLATATLPLRRFGQSLWRDEASSVWFARLPISTLLTALCDPHPPGYYLLLKGWLAGGDSEFWLRLPSLLGAVLAVALTYRLGRELCGRRCAWLASLLLALHPLQSWYAGEVRMYALAQTLGLLLLWLGWRVPSGSARGRDAAAYWLVALLALGIDYSLLLVLGLVQLLWLARGRPYARRWLCLQVAVLLSAALLWLNSGQLHALRQSYPSVLVAVQANRLGLTLTPADAAWLLRLIVIGPALVSLVLAWFWPRDLGSGLDQPLVRPLLISIWLGLLLLAAVPRLFTVKRQLIVLLPYLALLTATVLARLSWPIGELVAGLGLSVTLLALPIHQREPWRDVVAHLAQRASGQPAVVWVDELAVPAFDYYLHQGDTEASQVQWVPLFGEDLPQLPALTPQPGDSLWIVTPDSVYRRMTTLLPQDFYRRYQLLDERYELGIGLYHYQRRVELSPGQPELPAPGHSYNAWGLLLPSPLDTCQPD